MPFEADGDRGRPVQVEVCPSAVQELTWVLNRVHWHDELPELDELREAAPSLRDEFAAIWGDRDRDPCLPDTAILAERIGALLTDEADSLLDGVERAARLDGAGLELRSETPEVRQATLDRLERLRDDPALTRRYAAHLRRIWDLVRPAWEDTGREVVRRARAEWQERLRQGAEIADLFTGKHVMRREDQEGLFAQRSRVVVTPMYFASVGGFVVDMTSYVHVGGPARTADSEQRWRKESELVASRMKVLADGTRVALLRQLALEPASVMDLARRFRLAQPTVSNHVRLLRDAGLLESRKDGARVLYTVPRDHLERMLDDTRHILLEH